MDNRNHNAISKNTRIRFHRSRTFSIHSQAQSSLRRWRSLFAIIRWKYIQTKKENGVHQSICSLSIQSHAFRSCYRTSDVNAANDHRVFRHLIQHLFGVLRRYYYIWTDIRRAFRKASPRSHSCATRKPQVQTKQVPIRANISSLFWPHHKRQRNQHRS